MFGKNRDWFKNPKNATIYTPEKLSDFLYRILNSHIEKGLILDTCVGKGSLLKPWIKNNWETLGVDIEDQGFENTKILNFLDSNKEDFLNLDPKLIIMNPPFNLCSKNIDYVKLNFKGRPLMPELFLDKCFEIFGKNIPIVMFCSFIFRHGNIKSTAIRYQKFLKEYPEISSIVTLPRNIFENAMVNSEILIFNIPTLKPHYLLDF